LPPPNRWVLRCLGSTRCSRVHKASDTRNAVVTLFTGARGRRFLLCIMPSLYQIRVIRIASKQSINVLQMIERTRNRGISVIFITHNVHHAYPVGDSFTLLNRGHCLGTFTQGNISCGELLDMMAGGAEMQKLMSELNGARI
jgi:hypothetical protein